MCANYLSVIPWKDTNICHRASLNFSISRLILNFKKSIEILNNLNRIDESNSNLFLNQIYTVYTVYAFIIIKKIMRYSIKKNLTKKTSQKQNKKIRYYFFPYLKIKPKTINNFVLD
jgi:hypothetical protein